MPLTKQTHCGMFRVAAGRTLVPREPFGIMAIVNHTLDSFNPLGRCTTIAAALQCARAQRDSGALILDLGAESSRPGACAVDPSLERTRLLPLILGLKDLGCFLSVDTWHAKTAAMMLELGCHIINDISACRWDPELLDVLVTYKPGYVLMHCQGRPQTMQQEISTGDVVSEVLSFFERQLSLLVRAGLPEEHILLDCGIGFGKNLVQNCQLLAHISDFLTFGRPLLVGLSMKSLFADLLGLPVTERGSVTAVATALLWNKGVFWHRVHDVAGARHALLLAHTLQKAL